MQNGLKNKPTPFGSSVIKNLEGQIKIMEKFEVLKKLDFFLVTKE